MTTLSYNGVPYRLHCYGVGAICLLCDVPSWAAEAGGVHLDCGAGSIYFVDMCAERSLFYLRIIEPPTGIMAGRVTEFCIELITRALRQPGNEVFITVDEVKH